MSFEVQEFPTGTMYFGDCLEILPTLGKGVAEVCVTSPPYNLAKTKANTTWVAKKGYRKGKSPHVTSSANKDAWYEDSTPEWVYQGQQKTLIENLIRSCRSSVFYNHRVRYAWSSAYQTKPPSKIHHPMNWVGDFPIWCEIIWDRRTVGSPAVNRYLSRDERIYQIGRPLKWHNGFGLSTVWQIAPTASKNKHVCAFPEELVERCILPTTDEGDVVIDPYMGSGTTALVAIRHKRRFIGIENCRKSFDLACSRIENETKLPGMGTRGADVRQQTFYELSELGGNK